MVPTVTPEEVARIVYLDHYDPFQVLGAHLVEGESGKILSIRAFIPEALEAYVMEKEGEQRKFPMTLIHPEGFYEAQFPDAEGVWPYQLGALYKDGTETSFNDSYSFLPVLSPEDLYLFGEGTNYRIYEKLGARIMVHGGQGGVHFAVWAPSARRVSVVGNFNNWDGRKHQMRVLGSSGVWEIFVPGLEAGVVYKFEIKAANHFVFLKADPYGLHMELAPRTASIVTKIEPFDWTDKQWMEERSQGDLRRKPLWMYEVHLGSWRRVPHEKNRYLTYREAAQSLCDYVKLMGFTHIELMPIAEHPFAGSWGYQIVGYFAPSSLYGKPQDLMAFVDHCHREGIGVILDWVPAHFPRDGHGLVMFDGTHVFEHADPRKGEHRDWGTLIFNYGRNEVANFLISNALFWLEKYHIDGIRIDAVASMLYLDYSRHEGDWIPNRYGGRENIEAIGFIQHLNEAIHRYYPGVITMAEESTAYPGVTLPPNTGGLGFNFKWNMGWMHDTLEFFSKDPIYRRYSMNLLTFGLMYAYSEQFLLPLSHDEVVHLKKALLSKMPGDYWQQFANLRLLYAFMAGHPGKKLLFMGGEFGQWSEWNHNTSLDWHLLDYDSHRGILLYVRDLVHLYKSEPAMYEVDDQWGGFEWIDFSDVDTSVLSFLRRNQDRSKEMIYVLNLTPVVRRNYRVGVNRPGLYREMINSDAGAYGGTNVGNGGAVEARREYCHNRPFCLNLTLPPLGALILKAPSA